MEIGVKMESINSSKPDKTLLIGILVVHKRHYNVFEWAYSYRSLFDGVSRGKDPQSAQGQSTYFGRR